MVDGTSPEKPQKFVLILGMHRSGTSALSRALNLAGLRLPKDLLEPNQDNPMGFWEPKSIVKANNQLLQEFDRHWADPKPLPERWVEQYTESTGLSNIVGVLQTEISNVNDSGSGIVIKDPRLSRVMPVWRSVFRQIGAEPICLIACRNPMEVYRSLEARDKIELNHALELWLSYMLEAELVTRGMRRIAVHYDDLLTDWRGTLQTISGVTGMPAMSISEAKEQQIDLFLNKDLRHHRLTLDKIQSDTPLLTMVKATYELYSQVDGLAAPDHFDDMNRQRKDRWSKRSPGDSGSGIIYQMPSWHVEQSWDFIAREDYEQALSALNTAIEMAPDIARIHFIRGNVLARMGKPQSALEAQRTAVQLDEKVPRFHRAFCNTLNQLGKHEEAADAIGVLAQLEPSAETHHQHGNWLARIGRFTEAVTAQRKAIALDRSRHDFYRALSNALDQLGRKEEAYLTLSKAIESAPPNADLYDRLGGLLAGLNNWQDATEALDKAVTLRCQLLGFRKTPVAGGFKGRKANSKSQLLHLMARLGARHWAEDLSLSLQKTSAIEGDQAESWPLGRTVHDRPLVPITDHCRDSGNDKSVPLLSIMIPVYGIDNERWLQTCLDSVLAQDQGPDWAEIVIVDDASGDKAIQLIANAYAPRVQFLQNPQNLGLVGNHNHCISLAKGTFVHILHQDDYVEQGFYDALLKPMQSDETLVAGFTHNRFVNAEGRSLSKTDPPRPSLGVLENWHIRLSQELRIQFPSIIVRRSSYQKVGGFYPGREFSFDWDLWNLIAASGPVWYDPRPLAQYRVHESSASYGFTMKDRVVDLMQTVASMLQLLPCHSYHSTAEMGIYKFFLRYWGLVTNLPFQEITLEQSDLVEFLLRGWTDDHERDQILKLLHELTN